MIQSVFSREFREQCLFRFRENYPRIEKCLNDLNDEQVWRRPNESSNSIANLILHLSGNIRQYIISSLGENPDVRERDQEFSSRNNYSKEELLDILRNTCKEAEEVMENCSESEFLRMRTVQGFDLTGVGIMIHVIEHFSYHTGQIAFYTKELLDQDLAFYGDMDLTVKNES